MANKTKQQQVKKEVVATGAAPDIPLFVPSQESISILGRYFVDQRGRVLGLRGANVGSASKVPNAPLPKIHEHASGSYVNHPFPVAEAPEHWARLKSWGLTYLRINVTWDAIEHAGPGIYDEEYLKYLRELLQSLEGTGLVAYVSIHQDVWSRYSGGSGAPGWTLEAAGFDLSNDGAALEATDAAFLHGIRGGRLDGERGLWPTGYQKLAAATMNTLFWGGETFAPQCKLGSKAVNIQQYLQDAFIGAWEKLIDAVGDLDTVIGFQMMNEPHPGYIGLPTVDEWNYNTDLHLGRFPSPLQSFALGAGHATEVPVYTRSWPFPTRVTGRTVLNKGEVCVWRPDGPTGGKCPWEREGVWAYSEDRDVAIALREDYFTKDRSGNPINWYTDCYYPYVKRWEKVVLSRQPKKACMLEPIPNEYCPVWPVESRPKNFVFAPHWYDLNTMFNKTFGTMTVNVQGLSRGMFPLKALYFGEQVKDNYELQVRTLVREARAKIGEVPIVFGECGVPIDLNHEEAFTTGDWKWQERMMDALISAMEASLVHFNLWAYNPRNRDDVGDDWNAESFSWYSEDNRQKELAAMPGAQAAVQSQNPDVGARLLSVIVRPYAIATSGHPLSTSYERSTGLFTYRFRDTPGKCKANAPPVSRVTEIFLPRRVYGGSGAAGIKWALSVGGSAYFDTERERMFVWFNDTEEVIERGANVTRRIDVWVREANDPKTGMIIAFTVLIALVGFVFVNELSREYLDYYWVNLPMLNDHRRKI